MITTQYNTFHHAFAHQLTKIIKFKCHSTKSLGLIIKQHVLQRNHFTEILKTRDAATKKRHLRQIGRTDRDTRFKQQKGRAMHAPSLLLYQHTGGKDCAFCTSAKQKLLKHKCTSEPPPKTTQTQETPLTHRHSQQKSSRHKCTQTY